jgi:hypothetical protein
MTFHLNLDGYTFSEGGLGTDMGIIRNMVLKTTIKKALLDVTEQIETFSNNTGNVLSFGEAVMEYFEYCHIDKEVRAESWEATFANMVSIWALRTMPQSPSNQNGYLIQTSKEGTILVSLLAEWVISKGGSAANIYREFVPETKSAGSTEGYNLSEMIDCPNCQQRLRVPTDKTRLKMRCPRCQNSFYLK